MSSDPTIFALPSCRVVVPERPVTSSHLAIELSGVRPCRGGLSIQAGLDVICAYARASSALRTVSGCDGFNVSLAFNRHTAADAVGEPVARQPHPVLHVFGRAGDDSPFPVLARPAQQRPAVAVTDPDALRHAAVAEPSRFRSEVGETEGCACCAPEVERDQELWRRDGVRVIRPHRPVIDWNVLVMPLRHVASPAALTAEELVSIWNRLAETGDRFGCQGLSVFLNDGARASQHIPHVHIHVFGRSPEEEVNPFVALRSRTDS